MIRTLFAFALVLASGSLGNAQTSPGCAAEIADVVNRTFHSEGPYEVNSKTQLEEGLYSSVIQVIPGRAMHSRGEIDGKLRDETIVVEGRAWRNDGDGFAEVPLATTAFDQITNPIQFFDGVVLRPRCYGLIDTLEGKSLGYALGSDVPGVQIDITIHVSPVTRVIEHLEVEVTDFAQRVTKAVSDIRHDRKFVIEAPK